MDDPDKEALKEFVVWNLPSLLFDNDGAMKVPKAREILNEEFAKTRGGWPAALDLPEPSGKHDQPRWINAYGHAVKHLSDHFVCKRWQDDRFYRLVDPKIDPKPGRDLVLKAMQQNVKTKRAKATGVAKTGLAMVQDGDTFPIELDGQRVGWVSSRPNNQWVGKATIGGVNYTGWVSPTREEAFKSFCNAFVLTEKLASDDIA